MIMMSTIMLKLFINIFGEPFIDYVICSNDAFDEQILQRYKERNAHPVSTNKNKINRK